MTDTQPLSEKTQLNYFASPVKLNPQTGGYSEVYVKADPSYDGPWPQGAHPLLPRETQSGSFFVSVSKTPEGKVITQAFEVTRSRDGKLIMKESNYRPALTVASDELDIYSVTPSEGETRLEQLRRLQPGNEVTAENRTSTHVQLLPAHPVGKDTKIQFGLITPADMVRYKQTLMQRVNRSFSQPRQAVASAGAD